MTSGQAPLEVTHSTTSIDGTDLWPIYSAVFGDFTSFDEWKREVWDRHRQRDGFRLVRAYDHERHLIGFAYGYTGEYGQWWTNEVAKVLAAPAKDAWLGGHFELVSIGVVTSARRRGVGRQLLRATTDGVPNERLLLMVSADPNDAAHQLYVSEGWQVIGPGLRPETVVMGRRASG